MCFTPDLFFYHKKNRKKRGPLETSTRRVLFTLEIDMRHLYAPHGIHGHTFQMKIVTITNHLHTRSGCFDLHTHSVRA